jgi:hypothetical protein
LDKPERLCGQIGRRRVRAAGINPIDYKLRAYGTYGHTLPAILGWDGAGVVDRAGPAVTRVRPGDEVYFCDGGFGPTPGTYAELCIDYTHEDVGERLRAWTGTDGAFDVRRPAGDRQGRSDHGLVGAVLLALPE